MLVVFFVVGVMAQLINTVVGWVRSPTALCASIDQPAHPVEHCVLALDRGIWCPSHESRDRSPSRDPVVKSLGVV